MRIRICWTVYKCPLKKRKKKKGRKERSFCSVNWNYELRLVPFWGWQSFFSSFLFSSSALFVIFAEAQIVGQANETKWNGKINICNVSSFFNRAVNIESINNKCFDYVLCKGFAFCLFDVRMVVSINHFSIY